MQETDTIAAVATPPGYGGVGVVRVSGPLVSAIADAVVGSTPKARNATFAKFRAHDAQLIDQGIALFFSAPHSFTGEDVLELQGHGGPIVMDMLLRRALELGARHARPGEFSQRAFLNGKIDLAQAEAIADLIESSTEVAARLAVRTLQGEFSRRISTLVEDLTRLRTFVEAALDFPDDEFELLADARVQADIQRLIEDTQAVKDNARQGQLIREGIRLVIAGPPNAGKSSLLNALSGTDTAIVTDIPGTTRDLLHRDIQIDGMPLQIVDTAGLRHSTDPIEQEGIRRAKGEIEQADLVLWVYDASSDPNDDSFDPGRLPHSGAVTLVRNKIDLVNDVPGIRKTASGYEISISARNGAGLDLLRDHLKEVAGFHGSGGGEFIARRRHLDALERALLFLRCGVQALDGRAAPELMAEDLRQAQQALAEITGEFSTEDLLGRIFSSFCIGK